MFNEGDTSIPASFTRYNVRQEYVLQTHFDSTLFDFWPE
jgi:hypothetical protein